MNFRKLSHVFYAIHFLQEQYITPINIFQENYSFSEKCRETNLFLVHESSRYVLGVSSAFVLFF